MAVAAAALWQLDSSGGSGVAAAAWRQLCSGGSVVAASQAAPGGGDSKTE